ncbi:u22-Nephitoxin-Nsp1c_1 [Nephila pilipes]|uniref:U22-Nephitoxin-Nsp1c_1 n=1 Tax=Nephila pilipes TaxID=299642 RepID=A0A8X6QAD0_NEPPI|nr:u22-Nephitoxin-Nsp1c_1 [Nephila pilipes]
MFHIFLATTSHWIQIKSTEPVVPFTIKNLDTSLLEEEIRKMKMIPLYFLLILSCLNFVVKSENAPLSPEERKAIQEQLDKLHILEYLIKAIFESDEAKAREEDEIEKAEKCLPIGAECTFGKQPKCCSIRTRCVIWDRQGHDNKGNAKWTSHCREYNAGKWMDDVNEFFKKLG